MRFPQALLRVLLGFLPSFFYGAEEGVEKTSNELVDLGFTGFSLVSKGFTRYEPGLNGFYRVLPGFTWFQRV